MLKQSLRTLGAFLSISCLTFLFLPLAVADDPQSAEAGSEMMDEWMKFAEPGPSHKHLERMVGTWNTVSTDFSTNPDQPIKAEGVAVFEMIMGGRFVKCDFKSDFGGMPMQGMGLQGYDNKLKKYVGTWIDNFGSGMMRSVGTYDEKTDTLTENSTGSSPMGEMKMKMVTKYKSKDKFQLTMYTTNPDGSETKTMQIDYTRAK
ncbi:MAG: DUF1579 domain-containing protein [Planctomycetota bacterium]